MQNCGCNSKLCKHTPFVHLHLHTDFSLLDGASKSDSYIKLAKEYNHPAITILDHGNVSGGLTHFQKCKTSGIKPILGMEAYLNDNLDKNISKSEAESTDGSAKNTHQSIIVKDQSGYVNLNKLTYLSFTEGYYYKGRITTDWLFENKKGLIVTSSCMASKWARMVEEGKEKEAEERIKLFLNEFGEDFYAELQFNEIPQQKVYNKFILKMIKKYDIKPIITGDVHYAYPEDNRLQDVLIAVNQRMPVGQAFSLQARHLSYASVEDLMRMNKEFGYNYPESFLEKCIENTLEVSNKCTFDFETDIDKYPKYEATQDVIDYFKTSDTKDIITKLSHAKLKQKLNEYKKDNILNITPEKEKEYYDRLNYELKVIDDKKMLDYFLVVWELVRFCEKNSISLGPGRGSAAGCLLSWCLDITQVDSLYFQLYFERFLNPERKSSPDIDIDFESGTDETTLNFLYEKYGKERVVPVVTFGTFSEKGTVKDVVRALGRDTGFGSEIEAVTREMPQTPTWGPPYDSLEKWFAEYPKSPECSDIVRNWILNSENKEVIKLALKMQGQVRNLGKHAAGIIITPGPIWELMPVNICKGQVVSGFQESGSAKDVSSIGGLKLDRLKLETLNVIKDALKYIKERHGDEIYEKVQKDLKYVHYKHDDNLFAELRLGNNQGIFQFESEGMANLIKNVRVESLDELVACNALFRPGPMEIEAHDEYIKNKFNPKNRTYASPALAPLLEDTNGVLIYQEQLMFIANKLGGLTLGEGDNLRKVMDGASKILKKKLSGGVLSEAEENNKNYKSYKELWAKFIDGAKKNGLLDDDVKNIESWLAKYLGYSFNKSHSFAYSVLALRTLYLKHYYPEEFYCALLNHPKKGSGKNAKEKEQKWLMSTIMAAMNKGIEVIHPNRKSNWEWTIIENKKIAMGYSNISGLGEIAYKELIANNISKMSKDDFFAKKWSKFSKKSFEVAVKAGIFDDWSHSREELIELRSIKIKDVKQYDLFTGEAGIQSIIKIKKYKSTTEEERYSQFLEVCNLDLTTIKKISEIRENFFNETGRIIEPITNFEDSNSFYYFKLVKIEQRVSEKKQMKFYSCLLSDGFGTKTVNMWSNMYENIKGVISPGSYYITKFMKQKGFLAFNAAAPFRKVT